MLAGECGGRAGSIKVHVLVKRPHQSRAVCRAGGDDHARRISIIGFVRHKRGNGRIRLDKHVGVERATDNVAGIIYSLAARDRVIMPCRIIKNIDGSTARVCDISRSGKRHGSGPQARIIRPKIQDA